MGAFIYTPSNPLGNLVWQTLKDNEELLEKLDPNLLVNTKWSLWPKTKKVIKTRTLWEYFTQYTNLPILANENVLKASICQGIQRGLFGYGLGNGKIFDTVYFKRYVEEDQIDISESSWLLKPNIATKFLPKEEIKEEISLNKEEPEPVINKPKEFRENGVQKVRVVNLEVDLEWQNWDNFFREVIDPLREENADIKIAIKLRASSEEGIKKDTLDLKIIESLNQRGIKWKFIEDE